MFLCSVFMGKSVECKVPRTLAPRAKVVSGRAAVETTSATASRMQTNIIRSINVELKIESSSTIARLNDFCVFDVWGSMLLVSVDVLGHCLSSSLLGIRTQILKSHLQSK